MPVDVAVIGGGAAGLATAIFTRRQNPGLRVALFEGKTRPGAKILISGGGRCNVTNTEVVASDFNGGTPAAIAMVLRAFPVADTVAFFAALGVPLREEPGGKLFPVSNRARDVLDALLVETERSGAELRSGDRVNDLTVDQEGFRIASTHGIEIARTVVIATGGLSVPKTGSDGWGYGIAQRLGHTIVRTTPALVPLLFANRENGKNDGSDPVPLDGPAQRRLSGVSHPVRIDLRVNGRIERRISGPLLWTHMGISGPAALDVSRHWLRGELDGRPGSLTANLCPDQDFESLESMWLALARDRPRLSVASALAQSVPRAVAEVIVTAHQPLGERTIAALTRDERRHLVHTLLEWPLPIAGSRGFTHAEVTAGGVALGEISPRTMESRIQPGLFFVGEVLDVDGRLGGFNFQWSWASAKVAAQGIAQSTQST